MKMKDIRPIRSEADHAWAVAALDTLMDAAPGSEAGRVLDVLADLIDVYEMRHHRIAPAEPREVIRALMTAHGLTQRDMADVFGSQGRASEVLSGKRPLTVAMIRRLQGKFAISADVLLPVPEHVAARAD